MSAGHDHAVRAGRRHLRSIAVAFGLVAAFSGVELVAGWWTGSLALISDAGHMATDAIGLGMSLAAIVVADRVSDRGARTYGLYRAEILAALINSALLFAVAGYVAFEAVRRLGDPVEVLSGPMLIVAVAGLGINLAAFRLLRHGAAESLNVEGAYLEVVADLIGSLGVIVAAVTIALTDWTIVDPIIGAAVGLFILPRAWRLARQAVRILIQAAPPDVDLDALEAELRDIPGVVDVHDLHVWTLTSEMDVGTVHLRTPDRTDTHPVLDQARSVLDAHGIAHVTLQVEPESHEGCAEMSW